MNGKILKSCALLSILMCSSCVVDPGPAYVGGPGPVAPGYGYYGYGPSYPWDGGVTVDIAHGYGHGGYYGRGYHGGGYRGGYGGPHGGGGYHGGAAGGYHGGGGNSGSHGGGGYNGH